jgi:hypothetical protein
MTLASTRGWPQKVWKWILGKDAPIAPTLVRVWWMSTQRLGIRMILSSDPFYGGFSIKVNTNNVEKCTDEKFGENASNGLEAFVELIDVNST